MIDVRHAAVLVEGRSDEAALRALAERHGRDLDAEGIAVEVVGGAGGFVAALLALPPASTAVAIVDIGEVEAVRRGLDRAGLGGRLELHVCDLDLEDELIRALGAEVVEDVVRGAGELRMFRTFQDQPFQRDRPLDVQLRRFLGTKSGRRIRYGRFLVDALDLERVPRPLDAALAAV